MGVFLCYARNDGDFALSLAENLKARGVPVWLDQWNIPPGAEWNLAIDAAIRTCLHFLIVLSPAATTSDEVEGEWRQALEEHKVIFSVLYRPCEIPRQLLRYEMTDLSQTGLADDAHLTGLAAALLGQEQPVPSLSDRQKFINLLVNVPNDARAFDHDFSKDMVLDLSRQLSNDQFKALHDLRVWRNHTQSDNVMQSHALKIIGGSVWQAHSIFGTLLQFGFLKPASNPFGYDRPDPIFNFTALFYEYTKLMIHLHVGGLADYDNSLLGVSYWLASSVSFAQSGGQSLK